MKLKEDCDTLVILGGWNKNIFTGEWVSKFLLPKDQLQIEFPLDPNSSCRISSNDVRIYVVGDKLYFKLIQITDDNFDFIQNLGLKTADYLPHTPVSAFGINFVFEVECNAHLLSLLKFDAKEKLQSYGSEIKQVQYKHQVELNGKLINLSITTNHKNISFDFNFHFNVSNLIEFKETITSNSIINQKKIALELMKEVYQLDFIERGEE